MRAGDAAAPFVNWVTWAKLLEPHAPLTPGAMHAADGVMLGRNRWFVDSPLEEAGFELIVPLGISASPSS